MLVPGTTKGGGGGGGGGWQVLFLATNMQHVAMHYVECRVSCTIHVGSGGGGGIVQNDQACMCLRLASIYWRIWLSIT